VEIKDVVMNNANGEFDWAASGNELRIGWNSLVPAELSASETLVTLRMKTKETFTRGSSFKLTLAPDPLNELADDHFDVISNAILSVNGVEASANGIGQPSANSIGFYNYPNPFVKATTIAYTLPFDGNVNLEIRNMFGETVKTLIHEYQAIGEHNIKVDAGTLAPGVYTATISLDGLSTTLTNTIKLIVSK
jgi:hypothetical protein